MRRASRAILFAAVFFLAVNAIAQGNLQGGSSAANDAMAAMERSMNQSSLSLEDEYYLGRAVAATILSVYPPYNANPGLTNYLNKICRTIVINSPMPVIFNGFYVQIMDTMEYNAFASPGGHILISRGLVQAASSEDALAALIAHELAHILLRHAAKMIENMSIFNQAGDMAQRAAAFSGTANAQLALQMRNSVAGVLDTMMKNGFSREQEFEADIKAVELLVAAGYNPNGLLEMLQILERVQSGQAGGFNATHPSPAQRIANVTPAIQAARVTDTSARRVPRFISNNK